MMVLRFLNLLQSLFFIQTYFQLSPKYNKNNICLYRDDGLAVCKKRSGPQAEKNLKHFQKIFCKNDVNVTLKHNLRIVDNLDGTLNILDGSHKRFHKPISGISYIHKESNHPSSIIKQLPSSAESGLYMLSSDKNIFVSAAPVYQEALKQAGYNHKQVTKTRIKDSNNSNNHKDKKG